MILMTILNYRRENQESVKGNGLLADFIDQTTINKNFTLIDDFNAEI